MSQASAAQRVDGSAVVLTSLLLVTMVVTSSMQFIFGVLAPFLTEEFHVSRSGYGVAVSLLFLSGVVASFVGGGRISRAPMLALRLICGMAATALFIAAAAQAWWWVLLAAALMGLPLGLANPVTNYLVASRLAFGRQGTAVGIKQAGVPLGALVAGAALPPIALVAGWRAALAGFGILAVFVLLAGFSVRETPNPQERRGGTPGGLTRFSLLLALFAGFMGFGMSGINAFLPLFAFESLNLSAPQAGRLVAVIGMTGVAARIGMGVLGNGMKRFDALLAVLALAAACSTALLFVADFHSSIIWIAALGLGVSSAAWNTAAMLALVRQGVAAAASSGQVVAGFLLGQAIGPSIFGFLSSIQPAYMWAWAAVVLSFLLALAVSGISLVSARG